MVALTVQVVDNESDFFALQPEWDELQERSLNASIFTTFEWASACWTYYHTGNGSDPSPLILKFYHGQRLVGLAPLGLHKQTLRPAVLRHISMGGGWVADHLDLVSAAGYEQQVMGAFLTFLREQADRWHVLDWHELRCASPSYQALAGAARAAGLRYVMVPENVCYTVALPPTWEDLLARFSTKTRQEIQRRTRKVERECDARFEQVTSEEEVDQALSRIQALQNVRWPDGQAGRERYFGFVRQLAPAMLRRGWLDMHVVRAGDVMVAVLCNFSFRGTVYSYLGAADHDEQWKKYSVGICLNAHAIKLAIERGYHTYDMGRGDEAYKTYFDATPQVNMRCRLVRDPLLYHGFQAAGLLRGMKNRARLQSQHGASTNLVYAPIMQTIQESVPLPTCGPELLQAICGLAALH